MSLSDLLMPRKSAELAGQDKEPVGQVPTCPDKRLRRWAGREPAPRRRKYAVTSGGRTLETRTLYHLTWTDYALTPQLNGQ